MRRFPSRWSFLPIFFLLISGAIVASEQLIGNQNVPTSDDTLESAQMDEGEYPAWMDEVIESPGEVDPKRVYTFLCELPLRRPDAFTTACADFGEMVREIEWEKWGIEGASGSGIYSVNDCDPDCATGKRHEVPVRVWLEDATSDGKNYFLNTLKIVPVEAFDGSRAYRKNRHFNLYTEVTIDGVAYEGANWDVARDWKMNPHMRSKLPEWNEMSEKRKNG